MNKTISLSAIAMFAVMMGMAAFSPAFAAGSNGQKTTICHFEAEFVDPDTELTVPEEWSVNNVNNRSLPAHLGDDNGHEGHGDEVILNADQPNGTVTADDCLARNNA